MKKAWYKEGVVYQIYPRSYQDSNNDGIGDLRGIINRVPYIKRLGADIVWLSPVYKSPNDDNGYDISDYRDIQPEFGTMDDMKELIAKLHGAGIKLVMDLVVNHTSDEHEWFKHSVKNDPVYKDYYHWKKEKGNWSSFFGGDAWTYNEERQEYYLHLFSKKQPDLNWDNPAVREEVKNILKFWLDLGVDGFRCDVINIIAKTDGDPDGKKRIALTGREHYLNIPKIHEYLGELRDDVLSKYDCFTVGESVLITPKIALEYIADDKRELNMVFQFDHMGADNHFVKWFMKPFHPINLKKPLSKWQNALKGKGWNTLYLENHDQPRSISRFGNKQFYQESAKLLATMLYFQQGTPFIYQGQEIGMENIAFDNLDDYQDIETKNIYKTGRKMGLSHKRMMKKIKMMSRDNARTPMQWDDTLYAGFSDAIPWIKVNSDHNAINVATNEKNKDSILSYYKEIISLRKKYPIIVYGDYEDIDFNNKRMYAYKRTIDNESLYVFCNFSAKPLKYDLTGMKGFECLLSNYKEYGDMLLLRPYESRVYYKKA
ncbi:MAG TPA: alpha-glucosidase [Bacillota bacterium]|nr:alpha-glucosidase [Bacillota bacterium]HPF42670.1 alpha-glucosidase [Bacillota bacterium]HPJ85424.1 alpha-glucosidase [Bacillota bacterium]HPQ61280.1 alpha-glucosidase [Bacillota bacterium]HRX91779.1 alpha-glucosidase [Candidatus Izemoplasmatales bacterium]